MLDLVPLAGAGRQVANRYGKLELVGQFLKLDFPKTHTISIAAATVGGNHQPCGLGVALPSHRPPPSADRIDGKAGGVVTFLRGSPWCTRNQCRSRSSEDVY